MIGLNIFCNNKENRNHIRLSGFKRLGLNIEKIIITNTTHNNHDLGGPSFKIGQSPIIRRATEIIIPNALFDPISIFSGRRVGS